MTALLRLVESTPRACRLPAVRGVMLLAMAALFTTTIWGAQDKPAAPTPPPAATQPAEYVGSQTCQMCHEDLFNAFQKNPHGLVETSNRYGWTTRACEACHGPGSKHVDSASAADIRNPAKLKAAEADKICLTCHLNQPTQVGRINSSHARNQVSCTACHSIHANGPNGLVARKQPDINTLCAGCHADVWASFQRPYRHRLPEGAMSCVDCHNPHGSFLPRLIQTVSANEPGCFKCHGDKRRAVHLRAPARPPGRLHGLPPAARLGQSAHVDTAGSALRLPGVPLQHAVDDAGPRGHPHPGHDSSGYP